LRIAYISAIGVRTRNSASIDPMLPGKVVAWRRLSKMTAQQIANAAQPKRPRSSRSIAATRAKTRATTIADMPVPTNRESSAVTIKADVARATPKIAKAIVSAAITA
jgi:hypothetical protein